MKLILIVLLSTIIFTTGCNINNSTEPVSSQDSNKHTLNIDISSIGKHGMKKTYFKTTASFIEGTKIPFIVPDASAKNKIHFPDTLYSKGIFYYANIVEEYQLNGDTLVVDKKGEGYNLYLELNSLYHNVWTEGKAYEMDRIKYLSKGNRIFNLSDNMITKLTFDFPLNVGKKYKSQDGTINYTVVGEENLSTKGGIFNTLKIEGRFGTANNVSQIIYYNMQYGIIRFEFITIIPRQTLPWDSFVSQETIQIQSTELTSINQ